MVATAAFAAATIGLRLIERDPEIAVVDPGEHLAGLDRLVVADQHGCDIAGDFRRDGRVVRLDIGVVGRDLEPADRPIVPAEMAGPGEASALAPTRSSLRKADAVLAEASAPAGLAHRRLSPGPASAAEFGLAGEL